MTTILDPRKTLNSSVLLLALFVIGLSASWAWHGYTQYHDTRRMLAANQIVDMITRASGVQAVERGLTSAAIGAGLSPVQSVQPKIAALRASSEAYWRQAMQDAEALAEDLDQPKRLSEATAQAVLTHRLLEEARGRVDRFLKSGERTIGGPEWIGAITELIARGARLREAVLASVDLPGDVAHFNHSLKRSVWLASEYAGRERGILAFYVGARQTPPDEILEELRTYRTIVETNITEILRFKREPAVDRSLLRAIEAMEEGFLGEFQKRRRQLYAGLERADYPVTASEWMEDSTQAIDTILDVALAATALSAQQVEDASSRVSRQVLLNLGLLLVTTLLVATNLSKVRQTTNHLYRQKELAEITLHSIGDAVITADAQGRVEYLNPVAEQALGWTTTEARGRRLSQMVTIVNGLTREPEPNPIDRCLVEGRVVGLDSNSILIRPDGKEVAIDDSAAPIRNQEGEIVGAVMVFYDVSSMRTASHLLSYHATHDPLTKLINRREFERRLDELLSRSRTYGEEHALCYLDLDQFKIVNDTCGHKAGDDLLRHLTTILQERLRERDTLARIGGDEFGLLLERCTLEDALCRAEEVRAAVKAARFVWDDRTFELSLSIGLVPIDAASTGAAEILSEADAACFAAKDHGRNCIQVYEPANIELAQRHGEMQWVSRITEALAENRFALYCQPIVPLGRTVEGVHCEVLVRMLDSQGRVIPPMAFIPAAERYNLMPDIDRWVIRNALRYISRWLEPTRHPQALLCCINISGASLGESLRDFIFEQLTVHRVPPQMICLEITETAAVANFSQAIEFIRGLRRHGCRFALDDFGSGLSSFVYLKNLPVDYLKIDGNLIKGIAEDRTAHGMVEAIHRVGQIMGLQTIAEFVSDRKIWEKLEELGVDYAQGYYIAEPRPMETLLPTMIHHAQHTET